ncbi:MAG: adenylyltransferase/cytidyltransferase family protein [Nitrospirae bacterium]|nr:adenylyltransferase/cytidyltransferase family protein [Nitrospirota bacterium]
MTAKNILRQLKMLRIYSDMEWDEYINYFEHTDELAHYIVLNSCPAAQPNHSDNLALLDRIMNKKTAFSVSVDYNLSRKIVSSDYISDLKTREKITVGIVSGCYDLLHIGHIRCINFAKQFLKSYPASILYALTLSDKHIINKKGQDRPILNFNERLEMLSHVKAIDYISPLKDANCLNILDQIKPEFYFKDKLDATMQEVVSMEIDTVQANNGTIVYFPESLCRKLSTTKIIENIRSTHYDL